MTVTWWHMGLSDSRFSRTFMLPILLVSTVLSIHYQHFCYWTLNHLLMTETLFIQRKLSYNRQMQLGVLVMQRLLEGRAALETEVLSDLVGP